MRENDCVFYTAIVGGTDHPPPVPTRLHPCYAYCSSADARCLAAQSGWTALPALDVGLPARRTARWHKLHGPLLFPGAKRIVWLDATMVAKQDLDSLARLRLTAAIAAFPHPGVSSIEGEVHYVVRRYDPSPHPEAQLTRYKAEGIPNELDHFETGVLVYDNTPAVQEFFQTWWSEIANGSYRDQISFPYALWKQGLTCQKLGPGVLHFGAPNPYVHCRGHLARNKQVEIPTPPQKKRYPVTAVRILGNELTPRDTAGSRLRNLYRILEKPAPPHVRMAYLINSVHDKELADAYRSLLRYRKLLWGEVQFDAVKFYASQTDRERVTYAININAARNLAVDHFRHDSDVVLVLDSDIYLTSSQWQEFEDTLERKPGMAYYSLPYARVDANEVVLSRARESVIAFRHWAPARFDETIPFGESEKIELLARLGHDPLDSTNLLDDTQCVVAGTCNHLALDRLDTERHLPDRITYRQQSVDRLLYSLDGGMPSTMAKLGVAIVTYKFHGVAQTLAREACAAGTKVLVIDNSGDYVSVVHEEVYRSGENLGWVQGANQGLKLLQADSQLDYFLVMHNDLVLSPDFFKGLMRSLPQDATETLGVVGPLSNSYALGSHRLSCDPRRFKGEYCLTEVPVTTGSAMLLSRAAYESVGELDVAFCKAKWGADLDLMLRARHAGLRNYVSRGCYVKHMHSATARWEGLQGGAFHHFQLVCAASAREIFRMRYGPTWPQVVNYHYNLSP